MPAEWEMHEATWLTWPETLEFWPEIEVIESLYIEMIRTLIPGEIIHVLLSQNDSIKKLTSKLRDRLINLEKIFFHNIKTKDIWIRDYGPTFLVSNKPSILIACLWKFNVWGEKYDMPDEPKVSRRIRDILGVGDLTPDIVLEGGAIEVNGQGVCLTTEDCLLNANRNPRKNKTEMESYLKKYLGVRQVIWCRGDLQGDDTDGHIDNLARFVNKETIVCPWEEDPKDRNYECLTANYEILKKTKGLNGKFFNIVKLPMPKPIMDGSSRLPASYTNFYIGNAAVIVPVFDQPEDEKVLELLARFFPHREIAPLQSKMLLTGNGGPHCVTQQQPAVK